METRKCSVRRKKEKEEGKSNGDERVVLEKNYNNFVVIWQETREGNRGEQ
jgi:hypothetical protein